MATVPQVSVSKDLATAIVAWQAWLRDERRYSPHTLDAYTRDLASFCAFLAKHLRHPPTLADPNTLGRADFRSWLLHRLSVNLQAASTARALSVLRTFFRYLTRHGHASNAVLLALRTPRVPHSIPKALSVNKTFRLLEEVGATARDAWVARRDTAICLLLYGAGLRIGEALALNICQVARPGPDGAAILTVTGKGNKQRVVLLLPAVVEAIGDYLRVRPSRATSQAPLFISNRRTRLTSSARRPW